MKFGSIIEEEKPEEKIAKNKSKKKTAIIMVVIISLIIGISTFVISSKLLKKPEPVITDEVLSLTDENVKILYQYVTSTEEGIRYKKLLENESVTLDDFKNEDKFFYALQFSAYNDFEFTGELDKDKNKIYTISDKKIKEYMQRFFGPNVTYNNSYPITHEFDFSINKKNIGTLKYNKERNGYDTVFDKASTNKELKVEPFYTSLDKAIRKPDGKIVLKEKIIYTKVKEENTIQSIEIYKDPAKSILIDNKTIGINDKLTLEVSDMKNTGYIEYTFALNNNIYYFESSKFTNQ